MELNTYTDLELINQFRNGSNEAYEELVNRHESKIYSIALRYTKSTQDAEEVLQDVCLTLYKKVQDFAGKSAFTSWLYRVVVNSSLMKLRKNRQNKSTLIDDLGYNARQEFFTRTSEELKNGDSVSQQNETREILKDAIERLGDEYKTVFIMRDIDGLSNQEVSEILGLSVPAVKSRLHRARLMLQKKLERYWLDYTGEKAMQVYDYEKQAVNS